MSDTWNLDILYKGLDDPKYENDMDSFKAEIKKLEKFVLGEEKLESIEDTEQILRSLEQIMLIAIRLNSYISFRVSVDTENGDLMAQANRISKLMADFSAVEAAANKLLATLEDIDAKARQSELINEYAFLLKQAKKEAKHLLSNEEEAILAGMDTTGASAWSSLQSYLSSTVKVDFAGEEVTLSQIRNLAYDADQVVRRKAYEAELAAYPKIADSVAFALNNIKNQTWYVTEKRGYKSPLEMTLEGNRMTRKTLDAMMLAIDESLPAFRAYFKKKGQMLGHENGLPWYELFAPVGSNDKKYTIDECKDYLLNCFGKFTPAMADLMKEAFENEWIDFYPRNGKEGGAYCGELIEFKQSRILTNYDGTFGAVDTLAHELGHAYHNRQLESVGPLNQNYPMQLAETASTFNETHLGHFALSQAEGDEKIALLESDIKEKAQCVVDIYSRYLFETEVFEKCRDKFLMTDDLNKIMLEAQKKTYGDGLDPEFMHPFMWVCKSHYYMSGLSFYNFPYAFGILFAQGLYALYLKEGEKFIPNYNKMLASAGKMTTEDCGKILGIDLESPDFWRASLKLIEEEIDEFIKA